MKLAYRIISLIMSLLVVFSTTGVVISKHICDGEIKDIAWYSEATPCEHSSDQMAVKCPVHEDMTIYLSDEKNGCCENTEDYIHDTNPQLEVKTEINLSYQQLILFIISYVIYQIHTSDIDLFTNHQLKLPPLINQKIPVLIQSFLL